MGTIASSPLTQHQPSASPTSMTKSADDLVEVRADKKGPLQERLREKLLNLRPGTSTPKSPKKSISLPPPMPLPHPSPGSLGDRPLPGTRVAVYWPGLDEWYEGTALGDAPPLMFRVEYEGGAVEHALAENEWYAVDMENVSPATLSSTLTTVNFSPVPRSPCPRSGPRSPFRSTHSNRWARASSRSGSGSARLSR